MTTSVIVVVRTLKWPTKRLMTLRMQILSAASKKTKSTFVVGMLMTSAVDRCASLNPLWIVDTMILTMSISDARLVKINDLKNRILTSVFVGVLPTTAGKVMKVSFRFLDVILLIVSFEVRVTKFSVVNILTLVSSLKFEPDRLMIRLELATLACPVMQDVQAITTLKLIDSEKKTRLKVVVYIDARASVD